MERTLVVIKPDAFEKGFSGNIIAAYERGGLSIADAKVLIPSRDMLERHYKDHKGKDFFEDLLSFMSTGKVMAIVMEGKNAVEEARRINGATDPAKAEPGTLRNKYGTDIQRNAVHASDTVESAQREIEIWFEQ